MNPKCFLFPLGIMVMLLLLLESNSAPVNLSPFVYQDFTLTNPGNLTLSKFYTTFLYKVKETKKTDLVIQFKIGKGYSTKIAIYNQLEDIKQNEKGEFYDFVFSYESVPKEIVIGNQDPKYIGKGSYYIVVYDLNFYYYDSIRVFSETSQIALKSASCYDISHLYSTGTLSFYAYNDAYEYIELTMSSQSSKAPVLEIRETSLTGALIKSIETSDYSEYIKVSTTVTGFYLKLFKKEGKEYDAEFQTTFCISFLKKRINEVRENETMKRFAFDTHYYFFADLTSYGTDEESSVMLDLDYSLTASFEALYCKYLPTPDLSSEDTVIGLYPTKEEENECSFQQDNLIDTTYHLYFKNTVENMNALLIYVKVKGKQNLGLSLRIVLPQPMIMLDTNQRMIEIDITVPRYFKIDPNTMDGNLIVSVSRDNVLSVIYGSLSTKKEATKPTYNSQLFGVNKRRAEDKDPLPAIFVKLYGGSEVVNFESYFTSLEIVYLTGKERPKSSIKVELNNCFTYSYFIGSYESPSNDYLSIETIYGMEAVYHKGTYAYDKKINKNLPSSDGTKQLKETVAVKSNVDLMLISCAKASIPTSMVINFTPAKKVGQVLKSGDSFQMTMAKEQTLKYELTPSSEETIGLEARIGSDASVVEVWLDNDKVAILNKEMKVYRGSLTSNQSTNEHKYSLSFISPMDSSLLSVQIGSDKLFKIITESIIINTQNNLITLKQATDYYSVTITLSSIETGINYCLSQGFQEPIYISLPGTNCQPLLLVNSLQVSNPYDKYINKGITPSEVYYISITFDKKPVNDILFDIKYESKEHSRQIKENTQLLIDTDTTGIRTVKSNDITKDLIVFDFIPCANKKIDYQFYFNRKEISELYSITEPVIQPIDNMLSEMDLKLYTARGIVSYNYISQKEYEAHSPIKKYTIETKTDNDQITFKFYPFVKGRNVSYQLYVKKTDDKKELNDYCVIYYLKSVVDLPLVKDDESIIEQTIKVKESGTYQVNVLAGTIDAWKTTQLYTSAEVIVKIIGPDPGPDPKPDPEPDPKPDPDPKDPKPPKPSESNNNWIWILVGSIGAVIVIALIAFAIVKVIKSREISPETAEPFDNILIN